MSKEELDIHVPLLSECELAVALEACRKAGAVNAAKAISKHITRMQIEVALAKQSQGEVLTERK